jgi:glycosyltransferase involved in cell wall biosynthesis
VRVLRVLHLINDLRSTGGAEVVLRNVVPHLARSDLDVWVGSLFGNEPSRNWGLDADRLRAFDFPKRLGPRTAIAFARLVRFLQEHRVDVLHTHLFESGIWGRLAALRAGTRVLVVSEHTADPLGPLAGATDRWLARRTTAFVAVSAAMQEHAVTRLGVDPRQVAIVHNAVDLAAIDTTSHVDAAATRRDLGLEPRDRVVLAVGRLVPQKGFGTLLDAAPLVLRACPEALFLVVGRGHLQDQLLQRARALGIAGRFRFVGARDDVHRLMRLSELLALPSNWEPFGLVLIEAGACGRPVVATRVGGVPEVVEDERTGLLVEPGDPGALAGAIGRVLADPAMGSAFGAAARARVEAEFRAEDAAARLSALYEVLMGPARQRDRA